MSTVLCKQPSLPTAFWPSSCPLWPRRCKARLRRSHILFLQIWGDHSQERWGQQKESTVLSGSMSAGVWSPHTPHWRQAAAVVEARMQGQGLPSHCHHWCGASIEQHTLVTRLRQGNELYASGWPQDSHQVCIKACQPINKPMNENIIWIDSY